VNFDLEDAVYQEAMRISGLTGKSISAMGRIFFEAVANSEYGAEDIHEAARLFLAQPRPEGSRTPNGYAAAVASGEIEAPAEEVAYEEAPQEEVYEEEVPAPAPVKVPVRRPNPFSAAPAAATLPAKVPVKFLFKRAS
jgi:hypothetical protein